MSAATPGPRTGRPVTAPAYYLGRPASLWLAAARLAWHQASHA